MVPIPQEKILKRIEDFKKQKHPEFYPDWADVFIHDCDCGELKHYSGNQFFTLDEVLLNPNEIYLSHNGEVIIGLPIEETLDYFEIPRTNLVKGDDQRFGTGKTKCSFFRDNSSTSIESPADTHFFEKFFGLKLDTFSSRIIEPSYGLRIDSRGQIGSFLQKILDEKIPLFINTFDLEKYNQQKRAYVINGFEI